MNISKMIYMLAKYLNDYGDLDVNVMYDYDCHDVIGEVKNIRYYNILPCSSDIVLENESMTPECLIISLKD